MGVANSDGRNEWMREVLEDSDLSKEGNIQRRRMLGEFTQT